MSLQIPQSSKEKEVGKMMNKVIMLNSVELVRGAIMTEAGLLGYITMKEGELITCPGELGDDKELRIYIKLLKRDNLSLFLAKTIKKRTAGDHLLEFERRARVVIEAEVINSDAMEMLIQRSQIVKTVHGLEFHFRVEKEDGLDDLFEIPDIMPCPLCGHAAHWDEKATSEIEKYVLSDREKHVFTCDSGEPDSCGESFLWEKST